MIQSSNTAAGEYTATNVNLPGLDAEHPNQGAFSHSITLARAFTTFVDKGELRALIYLFSRGASAFQNAALAPINSPVCMRIIGHLRETWNISLDVQDVGTCIFIELYLRPMCVHTSHPETSAPMLPAGHPENSLFYQTRSYVSGHFNDPQLKPFMDTQHILALECLLFNFRQEVPANTGVHPVHFWAAFGSFVKTAGIFRNLETCLVQYRSPGDNSPLLRRDGRYTLNPTLNTSSSHPLTPTVINRDHSTYSTWAGMINRINGTPTHCNVVTDPGWEGTHFLAGQNSTLDKYAWVSFSLHIDFLLGAKPNGLHTSSNNFHLDRINNELHYTIDNIRWADSATNHFNKPNIHNKFRTQ